MRWIEKSILLCFIIVFIIVVFVFDKRIFQGFSIPKVFFLYLGIVILGFLYIIKIIKAGNYKLPKSYINLPLAIYSLITIISCLLSVNLPLSIIGSYGRLEGLLSYLCYLFAFYITANLCLQNKKNMNLLTQVLIITSTILSCYGIIQFYTAEATTWAKAVFAGRLVATLGNPVFLGLFLVMTYPITIMYYIRTTQTKYSYIFGFCAIVIFWALYLTLSRGCILAWLFSNIFLFFILNKKIIKDNIKKLGIVYSLILFIVVFYTLQKPLSYISRAAELVETKYKDKTQTLVTTPGVPLKSRIYMWQTCFSIIKDYPILGIGLDTLDVEFGKYKTEEYFNLKGPYSSADRAHNLFIDTCVTRGILGLIVFFWLILAIFLPFFYYRKKIRYKERILVGGYLASIIAYLIQCQFNFPENTTYLLFFTVLGILSASQRYYIPFVDNKIKVKPSRLRYLSIIGLPFLIFLLIVGFRLYKADFYFKKGIQAEEEKDIESARYFYKEAIKINPYVCRYYGTLAEMLIKKLKTPPALEESIAYCQKALQLFPSDAIFNNLAGMAYFHLFEAKKEKKLAKNAMYFFKRAISLDKYFIDAYNNLGALYLKLGDVESAKRAFKKAVDLEISAENIDPALERLLVLGELWMKGKDLHKAAYFYKLANKYYPHESKPYINLGYIYYKKGEYSKAKEIFNKALHYAGDDEYIKYMLSLLN